MTAMRKWLCLVCGLIYNEAEGWPDDGIAPGTRWEDVPQSWSCPECGVGKSDFEMMDVSEPVIAALAPPFTTDVQPLPTQPIVIVGSGYAGYGLAQALRRSDPTVDICIVTRESGYLYSKPALSIALAQRKSAKALAGESPLDVERRLSIRIYTHCEIEHIDCEAHQLITNLGMLPYGQLVLANGASPIRPSVSGRAQEILSINNLQDYQQFRQRLTTAGRVAILGDGLIGCEFANDLTANGATVDVIGLGHWPMERLLPEAAGRHLMKALADTGVSWHLQTTLTKLEPTTSGYQLTLADGSQLETDLVLSAIGLSPNVALAKSANLMVGRGIKVNDYLQTSAAGIYALGDCIEINGRLLPYLAPINNGIKALTNTLLGQPTKVTYPLMPVTVKTPAAPLCLLPPEADIAGVWRCSVTEDGLSAGFYDSTESIRGFVLVGQKMQLQRNAWLQACHVSESAVA